MIEKTTNDGTTVCIFESVNEMLDATDPARHEYVSDREWIGIDAPTMEHVEAKFNQPWAEGQYDMQECVRRLMDIEMPELKDKKRRTAFREDEGDEVDLDRLRSGQPFWRTSVRETSTGANEVTIFCDSSADPSWTPRQLFWRGAVAVALAYILEERGYRVELWGVSGVRKHGRRVAGVCLKRTSDPLDVSSLINAVSGWFHRTAKWALYRTWWSKFGPVRHGAGVGSPQPPTQDDLDQMSRDANRIYSCGVKSLDGAIRMMRDELENLLDQ